MAVTEQLGLQIVTEGFQQFMSQMKTADGAVGSTAKSWESSGGIIGKAASTAFSAIAVGAAAAAAAVVTVGGAIAKLTLDAVPLQGIADSFEALAQKGVVSLDALRAAANGTVSDLELMRLANVALTGAGEDFGAEFGNKLPKLLEAARAAARATGQDVGFLFQSLVTGIKRSSPLLIDNTGLVLSVGDANEALAKQLGKSVDELTAEEKQIALLNATVEAGDKLIAQYGMGQGSAAEQMAQFKTQIQNTKDQIGLAFLPVLQSLMTPLLDLAQQWLPVVTSAIGIFAEKLSALITVIQGGSDPLVSFGSFLAMLGVPSEVVDSYRAFIETMGTVYEWLVTNIPLAIETARPFIELLGVQFQLWADLVTQVVGDVVAFALPLIDQMALFFAEKFGFIVSWAQANLPLFQAFFNDTLNGIKMIWDAVWPAIQLVVTSVWTAIETVISAALTALTSLITAYLQATQGDWSAAWETIKTAAVAIWETIKAGFETFMSGVLAALGTNLAAFKETWSSNWEMFKTIVSAVWDSIKATISTAVESIKSAFTSVDWGSIATAIIDGIANGISNGASAIASAAKGAAQAALDAAKNLLGIKSPSSVFREQVGRNISAGIAAGIADLAPEINAQVRAVSAPPAMQSSNTSVNTTNQYNLTTQSMVRPGGLALEFASMEMGSR